MSGDEKDEFIVEYIRLGNAIKVTAIDPVTMREVSIIGSPKVTSKELAALAIRKLKYVMDRDA
jgi:hypothetical protein